jgi:hypothetical protein
MVVNLIVAFVTLLMTGFLAVWLMFPHLRRWFEEPKYRFLEQQRAFPEVTRQSTPTERGA